jgi:hypothetical protein
LAFYVGLLRNPAFDGRPPALIACTAGGIALAALCAWWIALGGRGVLGRPRAWLIAAAFVGPVWVACWKLSLSAASPALMIEVAARPGARCFALTVLLGLWPLAVTAYFWRNTDATHPRSLGAALGMAAGAYAGFLVDLWCPVGYVPHVVFGHVLPIIVLTTCAGIVAGRRFLALRSVKVAFVGPARGEV